MRKKIYCLDGMRAVMSLFVLLNHFVVVYFSAMYWNGQPALSVFEPFWLNSPLNLLSDGDVAVQYFFVLSGFLLASSFFRNREYTYKTVILKCVQRYSRLLPLVLASVLFAYLLMASGLMFHLKIAPYVDYPDFLMRYNDFKPDLANALFDGFIRSFLDKSYYNGPLWTIKWELYGSILVILAASILKKMKIRRIVYILIAGILRVLNVTQLLPFAMGLFIADLIYNGAFDYDNARLYEPASKSHWADTSLSFLYERLIHKKYFSIITAIIGLYICTIPNSVGDSFLYMWVFPSAFYRVFGISTIHAIGTMLVIYSMLHLKTWQKIFSVKPLVNLGRISFSVYVFHWPLMLSLESGIFMLLRPHISYTASALLSFAVTLPVIIAFAYIMNKFIEERKWAQTIKDRFKTFNKTTTP